MTRVLRSMRGTVQLRKHPVACKSEESPHSLLINVRTDAIKLIIFALMLAVSWTPPKPGSAVEPHPTV